MRSDNQLIILMNRKEKAVLKYLMSVVDTDKIISRTADQINMAIPFFWTGLTARNVQEVLHYLVDTGLVRRIEPVPVGYTWWSIEGGGEEKELVIPARYFLTENGVYIVERITENE